MNVPSDSEVAEHLKSILDSSEFQGPAAGWALQWVRYHLKVLLDWIEQLSPFVLACIVVGCLVVLGAAGLQIWYAFRTGPSPRWGGKSADPLSEADSNLSPEAIAERSLALASAGRFRDAARALQQSLLVSFCRRQGLPWESTLADWEWVRLLGGPPGLVDFTRRTQQLAFGAEPNRSAFEECFGLYRQLVSDR